MCRLSWSNPNVPHDGLQKIWNLENGIGNPRAAEFNLDIHHLTTELLQIDIRHFSSLHSVTTTFEFFATYLIFRSCRGVFLLPQSWIDLHLPRFALDEQTVLSKQVSHNDSQVFARSLLDLVLCFCDILSELSETRFPGGYPSRILHERNTDLLLLSVLNLWLDNKRVERWQYAVQKLSKASHFHIQPDRYNVLTIQ